MPTLDSTFDTRLEWFTAETFDDIVSRDEERTMESIERMVASMSYKSEDELQQYQLERMRDWEKTENIYRHFKRIISKMPAWKDRKHERMEEYRDKWETAFWSDEKLPYEERHRDIPQDTQRRAKLLKEWTRIRLEVQAMQAARDLPGSGYLIAPRIDILIHELESEEYSYNLFSHLLGWRGG